MVSAFLRATTRFPAQFFMHLFSLNDGFGEDPRSVLTLCRGIFRKFVERSFSLAPPTDSHERVFLIDVQRKTLSLIKKNSRSNINCFDLIFYSRGDSGNVDFCGE